MSAKFFIVFVEGRVTVGDLESGDFITWTSEHEGWEPEEFEESGQRFQLRVWVTGRRQFVVAQLSSSERNRIFSWDLRRKKSGTVALW